MADKKVKLSSGHAFATILRLFSENVFHRKKQYLLAVFLMMVGAGATAGYAALTRKMVDGVVMENDSQVVIWVSMMVIVLSFVKGMSVYLQTLVVTAMQKLSTPE